MIKKGTVLQVVPRLVTGGVERGTVEVTAALAAAKWQAIVVSAGGPMAPEIQRVGGKHITLPMASKNPYIMWRNIEKLIEIIEAFDVDIVHARSRAPAWSAYFAARHTGAHFVTTFHNAYDIKAPFKKFYNSIMAKGERIIAISDFVAAYARQNYGVPEEKLRTIPRGVDIEKFDRDAVEEDRIKKLREAWRIPSGQPVILLPGRLTRWKGQIDFIEAIAQLKRKDICCLIVGSGDAEYRKELEQHIKQRDLATTVRLVNECRDMPAAFCLADIVVSASTRPEGFGRVIVEAQAIGCVVIATEHGGAEEIIRKDETGFLVPPAECFCACGNAWPCSGHAGGRAKENQ